MSWNQHPTADFLDTVSKVLCAYRMQNVQTFQGWKDLFGEAGINQLETQFFDLPNTGMIHMLADDGLLNTIKVMFKYAVNAHIRKRIDTINRFFREDADYFGYGVYTGRKQHIQGAR